MIDDGIVLQMVESKEKEVQKLQEQINILIIETRTLRELLKNSSQPKLIEESLRTKDSNVSFRAGSLTALAYDAIKQAGIPLASSEIFQNLNRESSINQRRSLYTQLADYASKGKTFTKEGSKFGLKEWKQ